MPPTNTLSIKESEHLEFPSHRRNRIVGREDPGPMNLAIQAHTNSSHQNATWCSIRQASERTRQHSIGTRTVRTSQAFIKEVRK